MHHSIIYHDLNLNPVQSLCLRKYTHRLISDFNAPVVIELLDYRVHAETLQQIMKRPHRVISTVNSENRICNLARGFEIQPRGTSAEIAHTWITPRDASRLLSLI